MMSWFWGALNALTWNRHRTEMSRSGTALVLVDIQNDFLPPEGSLAVTDGDKIIPVVLELLKNPDRYDVIAVTLDYHPKGHISFASTHGASPFTVKSVPPINTDGENTMQMLWPDHCVQNTPGCNIEATIQQRLHELGEKVVYIRKGDDVAVDAYSGFADNQYMRITNLAKILYARGITKVVVTGLATDYCVKATAIDARKFAFETLVVKDAMRAVDSSSDDRVFSEMERWGCRVVTAQDVQS